jgi:hypothetical protein
VRKVVDSNFLQRQELRLYLAASTDNYAVLTDYAAMEAYKGDTLVSIFHSMAIVADYPKQVLVLKPTSIVCGLSGREAASPKSLIDQTQTREFPDYCRGLLAAQRGDPQLQQQLLEHGREATAHLERWLQDMQTMSLGIEQMMTWITKTHSQAELKILRRRENYTPDMREKLIENILMFAKELFKGHPDVTKLPELPEARDTFLFRYALCTYVLILKAIEGGGVKRNPEKLRNTMVDANFAAFATYFDGLMTRDKIANDLYADADVLLREIFARPPKWLAWLLRRLRRKW